MTSFAESAAIRSVLTLLLVFQIFGAAKPFAWNHYLKMTLGSALVGATLVQLALTVSLYRVYLISLPYEMEGVRVVPFSEFLSLNVTMTSMHACGLATMLVVGLGLVARWAGRLAVDAAECLPLLTGGDHVARTVPDLRNKLPMK